MLPFQNVPRHELVQPAGYQAEAGGACTAGEQGGVAGSAQSVVLNPTFVGSGRDNVQPLFPLTADGYVEDQIDRNARLGSTADGYVEDQIDRNS